jgi:hypothetical protein
MGRSGIDIRPQNLGKKNFVQGKALGRSCFRALQHGGLRAAAVDSTMDGDRGGKPGTGGGRHALAGTISRG